MIEKGMHMKTSLVLDVSLVTDCYISADQILLQRSISDRTNTPGAFLRLFHQENQWQMSITKHVIAYMPSKYGY